MKNFFAALVLIVGTAGSHATEPLPEVQNAKIEYPSPRAAYEALRNKQNVAFSKDTTGWTVAFDKSAGVIWSFAPDPSFPVVVKRVPIEKDGHLFVAMDVLCRGSKEACDDVVRRYMAINEKASGVRSDIRTQAQP